MLRAFLVFTALASLACAAPPVIPESGTYEIVYERSSNTCGMEDETLDPEEWEIEVDDEGTEFEIDFFEDMEPCELDELEFDCLLLEDTSGQIHMSYTLVGEFASATELEADLVYEDWCSDSNCDVDGSSYDPCTVTVPLEGTLAD